MTSASQRPSSRRLWGRPLLLVALLVVPAFNLLAWRTLISSHFVALEHKFDCVGWDPNHVTGFDPAFPVPVSDDAERLDLEVLAEVSPCVRFYRATQGLEGAAGLASEFGLDVIAGAAVLPGRAMEAANRAEIESLVQQATTADNVRFVVVGNETQLRRADDDALFPLPALRALLREVRGRVTQPVSTAEPYTWWLSHPEVAQDVDFIGAHLIPYWDGVSNDEAAAWVLARYQELKAAFPSKPVVILETGWPSRGPSRGGAAAGLAEQAEFLGALAAQLDRPRIPYTVIEGFDQPWKGRTWEGRTGTSWGLFDAERQPKLYLTDPAAVLWTWLPWAIASCLAALLFIVALVWRRPECAAAGALFGVLGMQLVGSLSTLVVRAMVVEYEVLSVGAWVLLALMGVLFSILVVSLADAVPVLGRVPLRRRIGQNAAAPAADLPFVSIHLPCRNEPPDLVVETIESLLALDYPSFEVIVVDNNTLDPALYLPVQDFCEAAGPLVRFFHVDELAGFKAGALNFALERADERAELIAVVDADYVVDPTWLSVAAPLFESASVAAVQAPQSYRGFEDDRFRTWARDEYVGFFRIGMVQRHEANAIVQHGTMVVLRAAAVREVGTWATWCIVEDAELGLRLLEHGHEVLYLDRELGAGLVPSSFRTFARQRERWAYGAVRILLAHWRQLVGLRPGLTWSQRYHFVGGWLPWLGAGLHPLFSVAGILVALLSVARPQSLPAVEYAYPLIGFTTLQGLSTLLTYRVRVALSWRRTLATLALGAALTPTISRAVVRGLFTAGFPFQVTDKRVGPGHNSARVRTWLAAGANAVLGFGLLCGAGLLLATSGWHVDTAVWATALCCQSLPSLCAAWCHLRH